ncbi:TonB family protein [Lacinutrix neustonica]|uniref:TonB family protein n=1 Tax=Lacinutrix neustonica TaxID=2980107 RepID=A0A9E8SCR5_9FLAO|nr:energy transducer TonB [Lacinutrix neustonica]WAC01281.1 TonB family protein [Lacinutrix neustonica]
MNNSNKALAITILIVCTMTLFVVSLEFRTYDTEVAEMIIDVTPETILEETEDTEDINTNDSPKTNKGFNETENYKHFAEAYKPIAPPKDFEDPRLKSNQEEPYEIKTAPKNTANASMQNEELTAFESVNSILNKRSNALQSSQSQAVANKNSSITYSLKNRNAAFLPIPIYLCDANGKIVVNITVNANGKVVNTSINTASNSNNECLQEHALDFAKKARFSADSKKSQIGTITFNFEGR